MKGTFLRIYRSLAIGALAASALSVAASAQAATDSGAAAPQPRAVSVPPPFADGSFETAPAGSFSTYAAGQSIGPWTVTAGSVDLIGAGFWAAADGDQSVDLSGYSAGAVSQTFATTPGTTYTVNYSLAGNYAGGPTVKTGMVRLDGQDVQDFTFNVTGKSAVDMGYSTEQFTFLATKPSSTLTFVSTTAGAYGPVLDNVRVQANTCCKTCG
jgi:choice-of-anchor C domain-containing protein